MNFPRQSYREPESPGPSILTVLVMILLGTYAVRALFALPLPPNVAPPGALGIEQLGNGEWWSVLTHIFTHDGLWHVLVNVLVLILFGLAVQRNAGTRHFAYLFLFSAWGGAALSLVLRPGDPLIGCSGGVMGIVGAFAALHPEYDLMRPVRRVIPAVELRLRAKHLFPALLVSFLVLEILSRKLTGGPWEGLHREAHLVHAGGLLTGWLYGRRLAGDAYRKNEWDGFFPQGLRRRHRPEEPAAPVTAGLFPPDLEELESGPLPPPARELSDSEFLKERVDPVLEKLYANGADNLTPEEKAILEEASRRFSRRNS